VTAGWAPKRFWATTAVASGPEGHLLTLDGRPARTPARALLALPTRALAEAIAAEWDAQTGAIRPATMPLTRAVSAALDRVAPDRAAVAEAVAAYGASDLLCYRAESPAALVAREAAAWDPLLDWAAGLGAPLLIGTGIVPVPQPPASLACLAARVGALDPFRLTALHELVTLSGSLVLGLAVLDRHLAAADAWTLSRIDEDWQAELWGEDAEAAAGAARRRADLLAADRLLSLLEAP
jgi:chaperone required for assembly of F1-ATPase